MVQNDLWDGLVPTRQRFMQRTFGWDSSNPTTWEDGAWFINTTENILYKYDKTNNVFVEQIIGEEEDVIALAIVL